MYFEKKKNRADMMGINIRCQVVTNWPKTNRLNIIVGTKRQGKLVPLL